MRKVLVVLVTALMLAFPARADAISVSPLEALAENTWRRTPGGGCPGCWSQWL